MPQTCRWAGAVRVVMPRGACGNGCLLLILWSRWRCRSVVTRAVAITARARWWAAARAGAGSEAVAVPARTVVIRVRRAVVNDRCRAATGWPVWGPLRNGVAMAAAERVAAWTSSVATIQAACSCRISSGVAERRIRPGARSGVVQGGLSGRRRNYIDVRSLCLGEGKRRASVSSCLRRLVVTRRSPYVIELSAVDRAALQQRARAYTALHHQVMRAKIVLLAAAGVENTVIADRLDVGVQLVSKWRKRFFEEGLDGLKDRQRTGRPRAFSPCSGGDGQGAGL